MAVMVTKTVTSEINNLSLTISHKPVYPVNLHRVSLQDTTGSFLVILASVYHNRSELSIMSLTLLCNPITVRLVLQSTDKAVRIYLPVSSFVPVTQEIA